MTLATRTGSTWRSRWQDAIHSAARILDDAPGALLVVLEKSEQLLERVREGIVTDIVEQGGGEKDADIFLFQSEGWIGIEEADEKLLRQVIDTKRMFEPRVSGPRIDEMDKTELRDVAKSLKVLGVYEGEQRVGEMKYIPRPGRGSPCLPLREEGGSWRAIYPWRTTLSRKGAGR